MFIHNVLFWVKPGTSQAAIDALEKDCTALLGKIPAVRHIWAGKPAMTPRDVVDNSYAVGLTVVLEDVAGHDAYQVDPLHKEFIARHKEIWSRVLIYDFK